jgi:hypothetical protein
VIALLLATIVRVRPPRVSSHPLSSQTLAELERLSASVGIGATQPVADAVLNSLDLPLRSTDTHDFLGGCLTHPDEGRFVLGLAYQDLSGAYKEDLAVIDFENSTFDTYHHGSYEKLDRRFRRTHHADRSTFPFATGV